MAERQNTTQREDLAAGIQALSEAVQAFNQATQVLAAIAQHIGPAPAPVLNPGTQIHIWEDDPFSEAIPTANPVSPQVISIGVPNVQPPLLSWAIGGTPPPAGAHPPGSTAFRFWVAQGSLARGVEFWLARMPQGTRWSTINPVLQVSLTAGNQLNAFYSRVAGLRFFQATVNGRTLFSGESPDVVCHELGHGILDALRPELFNAASLEAAAFHEAFGDISAMLTALQVDSFCGKVINDTANRPFNTNSRLSRLAEQLAWGIRQSRPDRVDPDSLRNASNTFFYRSPSTLPPSAPANLLSSEPHSLARVFTGAFLDALSGMLQLIGARTEANLRLVSQDMGQLVVDGVLTAPVVPNYFSQVAGAMVQAAAVRNNGRYRAALAQAFVQRGILSLEAVNNLADGPVPQENAVAADGPALGVFPAYGGDGAVTMLSFADAVPSGFRSASANAPDLPLTPVHAEFLTQPIMVHSATEPVRFNVASAFTLSSAPPLPADSNDDSRRFLEDLIQQGRVEMGAMGGMLAAISTGGSDEMTHKLENTENGLVLKRVQFDCGMGLR